MLVLFGALSVSAQQRLCLLEEFTQASCGPCAAQNPALNTLLSANTAKVVSIKYQTSWPGTDPMNAQNPTEVATRVTYYGVGGVPDIEFDGNVISGGAPSDLTTAGINTEYAVPSPLTMALSHSFNAAWDTVTINCTVTALSDMYSAAGALKLHIAMVEKEINFTTAPGSNGEKDFYSIMRKMYPNAGGTTMPDTLLAGQSFTVTFTQKVPTYIYRKSQIAIVGFVQNNTNKNVKQAAISEPIPLALNADATSLAGLGSLTCGTTVSPVVVMTNSGATTLTSATITYVVNGTTMTYDWTGSLAPGAATNVTLPAVTLSNGKTTVSANVTSINGSADVDLGPSVSGYAVKPYDGSTDLIAQNFTSTTFPPANFIEDDAAVMLARAATGTTGSLGSAKWDFYNVSEGTSYLYIPTIDMSTSADGMLTFDHAYTFYSGTTPLYDQMTVEASTDCGATWTTLFDKSGTDLATLAAGSTGSFTPSSAQWINNEVSLLAFAGQSDVLIRFAGISSYGNNLYVDNINTTYVSSLNDNNVSNNLTVYPNPATTMLHIATTQAIESVEISDITGKVITADLAVTNNQLDISTLANGTYFLKVKTNEGFGVKKFTVVK